MGRPEKVSVIDESTNVIEKVRKVGRPKKVLVVDTTPPLTMDTPVVEIMKDLKFNQLMAEEIRAINSNEKLRHWVTSTIKDNSIEGMKIHFVLILNKVSELPSQQRALIKGLCNRCCYNTVLFHQNQKVS